MTVTLLEGHVVDVLAGLPAGHFHTVVTSPPYAWLRAYGTAPQVWQTADGDALCAPEQHEWGDPDEMTGPGKRGDTKVRWQHTGLGQSGHERWSSAFCLHCHAWRGELGQEPTIELYVEHLVAVFRSVRRVLRADGTLWVNLAGCYFNDPGGQNGTARRNPARGAGSIIGDKYDHPEKALRGPGISAKAVEANAALGRQKRGRHPWLKPLDWVDVPGLFARAMQQDGWTWRSDVVWVKPSALPESVSGTRWERCKTKVREGTAPGGFTLGRPDRQHTPTEAAAHFDHRKPEGSEWADCPGCPKCEKTDGLVLRRGSGRPTKTHEHVHLYTKGPGYFYDTEAVRETLSEATLADGRTGRGERGTKGEYGAVDGNCGFDPTRGRNLRDVWTISPEPLKDAHYAAYPSALPERCIKAGTSEWGCCPTCGAPWARVVDVSQEAKARNVDPLKYSGGSDGEVGGRWTADFAEQTRKVSSTLGWRPTCRCVCQECDDEAGFEDRAGACAYCEKGVPAPVPCRVLDPFGGSGSTALAANRLGRDCTLVELKSEYVTLSKRRISREPLSLFAWRNEDTPEEVQV